MQWSSKMLLKNSLPTSKSFGLISTLNTENSNDALHIYYNNIINNKNFIRKGLTVAQRYTFSTFIQFNTQYPFACTINLLQ